MTEHQVGRSEGTDLEGMQKDSCLNSGLGCQPQRHFSYGFLSAIPPHPPPPAVFCELQLRQQNSNIILRVDNKGSLFNLGVRDGAVGWGTALQAGRSQVRFPMVLLEFFNP